ncbi:Transposase [Halodesulfovibrio marinisediminis DSM 17456]|uniref:Transposase n=1 Tax=Halodesulfovibrio marinisediminis DSM 17456 TaxID=1121457 RepID=A0A1N6HZC2_9BACT|nr:Transposase [Halodesulfovibrio marinisediminis DSM 17456]
MTQSGYIYTETKISVILMEGEASSKGKDNCCFHGISGATYYKWKSKYGGMQSSDLRRMEYMEHELKK